MPIRVSHTYDGSDFVSSYKVGHLPDIRFLADPTQGQRALRQTFRIAIKQETGDAEATAMLFGVCEDEEFSLGVSPDDAADHLKAVKLLRKNDNPAARLASHEESEFCSEFSPRVLDAIRLFRSHALALD